VKHALISPYAPMFSALGMASAGITRYHVQARPCTFPPNTKELNSVFADLEQRARREAAANAGVGDSEISLKRFVDMRFRFQVHELRIPVSAGGLDQSAVQTLRKSFEALYERTYGAGTVLADALVELVNYGVASYVAVGAAPLRKFARVSADCGHALLDKRPVFFKDRSHVTSVYAAQKLQSGNVVAGPALIEDLATTTVVHPGQRVEVDEYRNLLLHFRA
jgi:N-methylhydantoinase A